VSFRVVVLSALMACASSATIAEAPASVDPPAARASGLSSRKGPAVDAGDEPPLLATLAQVHTGEHVPLDDATPTQARFSALLSDRATGASGAEFIKVSAPAGTLTEVSGSGHEGRNAEYKVDGIAGTSKSNVVTEAIGGVSLTLTGLTNGSAVTVDVQPPGSSVTAIEAQVQSFVKLYNSTITAIQKELSTKPPEHPSTAAEYGAGSLFGDLELGGLLNTMRQAMYEPIAGLPSTMASPSDIGISTGAASASTSSSTLEGQLTLDPAKLAEAVHNNPVEARKMLEAWSKNLQGIVENAARPGGSLETRAHSDSAQVRNLSEQIDNMNAMIATREKALVQTYARLEGILSQNSSQGTWLTSQSEALTKAGG